MEPLPKTVGPYEVTARAGRGGMGDVFVARDPKLGRLVAIKRLPTEKDEDPKSLSRFRREARVLASLSHPNIATVYSLEEDERGSMFVVLEYVEGDTLRDVMRRGVIRVGEALRLISVLADALSAAHRHGVIHRDIKPSNVMIDRHGHPRLLDFGLAKLLDPEGAADDEVEMDSSEPTQFLTTAGTLIGTAGYMSPEQICGDPLDERTDVFSLGCVAYEMLAGQRPFDGTDKKRVLSATLTREPDWSLMPDDLPHEFLEVLKRCLAKDCEMRLADASALREAAEEGFRSHRSRRPGPSSEIQSDASVPIIPARTIKHVGDLVGETYGIVDDRTDEATENRFLCYSCGRPHEWVEELVGEEFLCTCGAKLTMPELIPGAIDQSARQWYHAVDASVQGPDFDSAVAFESTSHGEAQRRRRRGEVRVPGNEQGSDAAVGHGPVAQARARGSVLWVLLSIVATAGSFAAVMITLGSATMPIRIGAGAALLVSLIWLAMATKRWCGHRSLVAAISDLIEDLG